MRPRVLAACLFPCGIAALAAFAACGGTTVSGGPTNPLDSNEPATSSADPSSNTDEGADGGTELPGSTGEPNGNTTGTNALNAFLGCFDADVAPTCISCIEQGCAGDLRALEGACGAVIDCLGTCACGDDSCYETCVTTFATTACEQVVTHLAKCSPTECVSVCGGSSVSISVGGSDGGTENQPGGGTGTGVTSGGGCSALSTCCASLPSQEQPGCNSVVSSNDTSACDSTLTSFNDEGICN